MAKGGKKTDLTNYFDDTAEGGDALPSSGALAGIAPAAFPLIEQPPQGVFQDVAVEKLVPNPFQPRKIFDEGKLQELAESIAKHGVIHRIIVRRSHTDEGILEIVAGERRWRASMRAKLPTCPVEIRDYTDETMRRIALIENIQRTDLTAMELAQTYSELLSKDDEGNQEFTIRSLAESLGKDKSHVEDHVRLLRVPPEVQQLIIEDPKVSLRIIAEIGSIANPVDRADLIAEVRQRGETGWNTNDIIQLVKLLKQASQPAPSDEQPATQKGQPREKTLSHPSSPALQQAKFKVIWEKQKRAVYHIKEKIEKEKETYTEGQRQLILVYLQDWQTALQQAASELQEEER